MSDEPPAAAKVGVLRHDFHQPLYAIALYKSYVQTNSQGDPVSRWKTDPAGMLAKCAEALGLRRAFPHELSGLYTTEEMEQADNPQNVSPSNGNGAVTTEIPSTGETNGNGTKKSQGQRPYSAEDLRTNFAKAVAAIEARGLVLGPDDYTTTHDALQNLLESERDLERYLEYVSSIPYLEEMSEAHVVALLRLLKPVTVDGTCIPCEEAQSEAAAVIAALDTGSDDTETEEEESEV